MNSINTTDIAVASSPDADINGFTLIFMCQLFSFVKEWLQEGGVSTKNTMIYDNATIVQKERWIFSDADCEAFSLYSRGYGECVAGHSMEYVTDPNSIYGFTRCITTHFWTEAGGKNSCMDDSVRPDSDTNDKNTMTLLSKDRVFYTFMVDTLNAGNTCQARNDAVTFSPDNCNWYIYLVTMTKYRAGSRCTYNTPSTDTDTALHYANCLDYRLMTSLGADSVCNVSLITSCDRYHNMVQSLAPTCICITGLVGNLLSLCMFGSGAVVTPIAYQLLWLAGVDITFILTWWAVEVLPEILHYYSLDLRTLTWYQTSIVSVLTVCLRPLSYVTRSCTVWLTVLIGLYRYLAVCKPYGNLLSHCTQHGHKYVVLIVILSFLYNIPYFCEYYLDYRYTDDSHIKEDSHFAEYFNGSDCSYPDHYFNGSRGFFVHLPTGLVGKELLDIYSRIHAAVVVSLPCLILSFVMISILVKLRKRNKKKSNMQTSQTSTNSITLMLVTILVTFIICQLPYFVWYGIGDKIHSPYLDSFLIHFLFHLRKRSLRAVVVSCITYVCLLMLVFYWTPLLMGSYISSWTRPLGKLSCLAAHVEEMMGIEMLEMGPVNTRQRRDDAHP